ncbi:MAG: hypothetical protein AW11_00896 [Candidatus Accumulibacter regalis]|uniref:Uncharacterized protein n=1 Tax=Accumulibacter regalis TaxID=522306 RepID=A0A011P5H4_ACCRE|nr:hypothetical protein [Accumulibacter sp.]EXI90193.1 MAG: hypothetical protein AW11_00896 [Candidatus Accumulibacter regalis]HRE72279.1 hypothetical protein [Accumulibacter sp.]
MLGKREFAKEIDSKGAVSQLAVMAQKLATMKQGARTDIEPCANLRNVSQTQAAELLQLFPRSVATAANVECNRNATPEISQAVRSEVVFLALAVQVPEHS